jgi:GNAT superfamily N-acetyltransferase
VGILDAPLTPFARAANSRITVVDQPGDEEREIVLEALFQHNSEAGPPTEIRPIAILVNDDDGNPVGGLYGRMFYDWLFVEYLAIPEEMRGQDIGTALMTQAEELARAQGCIGIWLDTFTFQARGFYEKLGYSVFGELADYPRDAARYFLSKRL